MIEGSNPWAIALTAYVATAAISLLPTIKAVFKKIQLAEAAFGFQECVNFSEENRDRLQQHYSRLQGTLVFWKNTAAKYGRFHYYCVFWTILGGISVPILAQAITDDPYSKWLLTIVSGHLAILYVSHRTFKAEQNFKAFRLGESRYYDLRRTLLDSPERLGDTEEAQIQNYFDETALLREEMRIREVDGIASFEDLKSSLQNSSKGGKT